MASAKKLTFILTPDEAKELAEPAGQGGHQALQDELNRQLANGELTITLDDAALGRVIRYMTQYGSGGFQGRLHRALIRSLRQMLNL